MEISRNCARNCDCIDLYDTRMMCYKGDGLANEDVILQGCVTMQKVKPNELLRHARLQRGWSQADVAARIGSDPKTVGRWERGLTFPSLYLRQQLCTLFEQDAEALGLIRKEPEQVKEDETTEGPSRDLITSGVLAVPSPIISENIQRVQEESRRRRLPYNFVQSLPAIMTLVVLVLFLLSQFSGSSSLQFVGSQPASIFVQGDGGQAAANLAQLNYGQSGDHLYIDDALNSNQSAGLPHMAHEGQCFYKDNAYHSIVTIETYFKTCFTSLPLMHNFVYEITMKIIRGNCGGVIFRSNFPLMYYFLICSDGQYRFVRYDRDNQNNRRIIDRSTSSAIRTGHNALNTIAVVANEQHFTLYVNYKKVVQADDGAYQNGRLGMLAHTGRIVNGSYKYEAPTEIAFTNLRVWVENE